MIDSNLIMVPSPVEAATIAEILAPGEGLVRVAARPRPFRMDRADLEIPAGATLAEIVDAAIPDPAFRPFAGVRIAGHLVPRENWRRVRPKPGSLVEVVAGVSGGGDGGKDPLRTVLTIAVIVAAIYLGPQIALAMGFEGAFAASLATAAVATAGGLLVNAIAPPAKPKLPELSGAGSTNRDSPTYDIAGARNQARPFGVVPRVLGEHRAVPPYAALPYTEIVGDDEYLRMLFVWSIGPVTVEDRKIGETSIDSFDEIETEFRRGYQPAQLSDEGGWDPTSGSFPADPGFGDFWTASEDGTVDGLAVETGDTIVFNGLADPDEAAAWDLNGNKPLTLFTNDVFQEDLTVELTQAGGAQTRTSQAGATELSVDIVFPQGLVAFTDLGDKNNRIVQVHVEYSPAGAGTWSDAPGLGAGGGETGGVLTVDAARTSTVRVGHRWAVAAGQYDVRLTRLTADSDSTQIADACSWTALRSIRSVYPIDCEVGLAVEAVRIRATGQLRGVIDQYNGTVASILPDWDGGAESWVERPTRNPAAIYRALLQDAGQARPVADAGIAVADLETWHGKCVDRGYAFDAVIDFAAATAELQQDVASAGGAGRARPGGQWSVAIDEVGSVVQVFTPRNSWGFRGTKVFLDLPHGLRCRFNNRDLSYSQDERIVYRDGFGPSNATEFEGFEQFGVTDPGLIWVRGREHFAGAVLRPERYSINTDPAWLVCQQGSIIRVQHDAFLVGLGSARVKAVIDDGEDPPYATGFVVDELLEMETGKSYVLRIQHVLDDGSVSAALYPIDTETGGVTEVALTTPVPLADAPVEDDLAAFGEAGLETIEAIVLGIRPRGDLSAEVVFTDAAPGIAEAAAASRDFAPADVDTGDDRISIEGHPFFDGDTVQLATAGTLPAPLAEVTDYFVVGRTADSFQLASEVGGDAIDLTDAGSGAHTVTRRIPDFVSSISSAAALGLPETTNVRSDGTVLFREPDGSWTSRILLTLKKPGGLQTDIDGVEARFRPAGSAGPWERAFADRDAGEISLMPVEDGVTFDYQLRWTKVDGSAGAWTDPATHPVEGKTAPPADVTGFSAQQNGNVVTFRWKQVPDRDRNGYTLRYMSAALEFDWEAATPLTTETKGTLVTNAALPPGDWVVGIKALDTSGNESETGATFAIEVSNDNDIVFTEAAAPRWAGTLDGLVMHRVSGTLIPASTKLASELTKAELFEQFVPYPVAEGTYTPADIDLGFDAQGVRVWASSSARLGRGVASGSAAPGFEIDWRDDADAFDGFEPWTIGTIDGRHIRPRLVVDTEIGNMAVVGFTPTADVLEHEDRQTVAVAAGGTTVSFTRQFHLIPGVQVSAEAGGGGAARYGTWESLTTEGVFVRVFDSGGNDVGGAATVTATGA